MVMFILVGMRGIPDRDIANWEFLSGFLPRGWRRQAYKLGAFGRSRKISSPELLLRILFIHLAHGCSLRETSARALQAGWADVSAVALMKRLRKSSEWFRWMAVELLHRHPVARRHSEIQPAWLSGYRVRSLDATVISELGSSGTDWRLHYSLNLFTLACEDFLLTGPSQGESFANFEISPGDLMIADRAYSHFAGMSHVRSNGGDFLLRYKKGSVELTDTEGRRFPVLKRVSKLKVGRVREWILYAGLKDGSSKIPVRLCAVRKSEEAAERSVKRAVKEYKRKGRSVNEETVELQRFVLVLTSLVDPSITPVQILQLYRIRWQIELAFKRLKSIMALGYLPKEDIESCRAWLHGKLFVAMLVQTMVDEGRLFSPWGYPLPEA